MNLEHNCGTICSAGLLLTYILLMRSIMNTKKKLHGSKLVMYHVTLSPLTYRDAQEAENVFRKELKMEMVTSEPLSELDEEAEEGTYYLEALSYVSKIQETEISEKIDELVKTKDCFRDVNNIYRS